jgi:protein-disulfide isomerase-like protein with CxxC motif
LRAVPARVRYYTDPACSWSWAAEPLVRRLFWDFGESLSFTWVRGGLARDYTSRRGVYEWLLGHWLEVAAETRMPIDPLLWKEGPIASTYPACMAVKAAQEQAQDGGYRYLRTVREGLLCFRRKLDTTEALVEAAREAGLNVERFRVDLQSHAIVEAFGYDLDATRSVPEEVRAAGKAVDAHGSGDRLPFPSAVFVGDDGVEHGVYGAATYDEMRDAATAAGAEPVAGGERPGVLDALRRFGRMATREVEEVCGLPEPRAQAELWRLAAEWQVKPLRVVTGWLWEPA